MPLTSPAFEAAARLARAHEMPWPRDPHAAPAPGQRAFGVHHDDPALAACDLECG